MCRHGASGGVKCSGTCNSGGALFYAIYVMSNKFTLTRMESSSYMQAVFTIAYDDTFDIYLFVTPSSSETQLFITLNHEIRNALNE